MLVCLCDYRLWVCRYWDVRTSWAGLTSGVSHLTCMVGNEFGSSGRGAGTFNHWAIAPAQRSRFLNREFHYRRKTRLPRRRGLFREDKKPMQSQQDRVNHLTLRKWIWLCRKGEIYTLLFIRWLFETQSHYVAQAALKQLTPLLSLAWKA